MTEKDLEKRLRLVRRTPRRDDAQMIHGNNPNLQGQVKGPGKRQKSMYHVNGCDNILCLYHRNVTETIGRILFEECQVIQCMTMEWILPLIMLVCMVQGTMALGVCRDHLRMMVMGDPLVSQNDREADQQDL